MDSAPARPGGQEDVEFEISDEAAALIRDRGGELWIWPSNDRWPFAMTNRPGLHYGDWLTYEPEGLVIHVDAAIVPPKRWVLPAVLTERALVARWNGLDPKVFGRLPLAREDDDPPEPASSPLAHVRKSLIVPGLAWVFAVLWALRYVGVGNRWLWAARTALFGAISLAAVGAWLRGKLRERRADKSLRAELEAKRLDRVL